ncbi:hypothetical protein ABH999_005878 [Bradyrhizobium yuanmingense]|uniref:hypothetical protein n=1 Tax=Bradyrhizobium yuanmingense TaxID=108015 RepID=UPI00056396AD|nr:hypothetical protein [Bradyrhizobium yuanmingense]
MDHESDDFSATSGVGCEAESWSPEVISFYGDSETIVRKLGKFEMNLSGRRVFALLVEGAKDSAIRVYERSRPGRYSVSLWKGAQSSSLRSNLDRAIIENKGVHCVGEQTKAIVTQMPELRVETDIPAPATAKAAFSHPIRELGDDYVRATVYLLC